MLSWRYTGISSSFILKEFYLIVLFNQASGGIFEEFESATSASSFFHANYSVVPATVSMSANDGKPFNTLILHKQEGHKIFSI